MGFDEFDETEVMFSNYSSDESVETSEDSESEDRTIKHRSQSKYNHSRPRMVVKRMKSSSLPLRIPTMSSPRFDEGDGDNEDPMKRLPPHLIVERRVNEEMARSFSPLKGKNLCQVRNSILRITGFLER